MSRIHWPEKIQNVDLWHRNSQCPVKEEIRKKAGDGLGTDSDKWTQTSPNKFNKHSPGTHRKEKRLTKTPRDTWCQELEVGWAIHGAASEIAQDGEGGDPGKLLLVAYTPGGVTDIRQ